MYSQLFLHPPGYPLDVQQVGEHPLCEHFCPHWEHKDGFLAWPPIICVGVWGGWLVGSPGETWMINSVHPFSLHPLCIGSVVHPGWCACVCAQGTVVPTPEEGTESFSANCYLLGTVCPALPGLETTTARSCHQSADVVGEIYTETLKKQKD